MNTIKFYLKWVLCVSLVSFLIILFFSWPATKDRLIGIALFSFLLAAGSGITISAFRKIYNAMRKS